MSWRRGRPGIRGAAERMLRSVARLCADYPAHDELKLAARIRASVNQLPDAPEQVAAAVAEAQHLVALGQERGYGEPERIVSALRRLGALDRSSRRAARRRAW